MSRGATLSHCDTGAGAGGVAEIRCGVRQLRLGPAPAERDDQVDRVGLDLRLRRQQRLFHRSCCASAVTTVVKAWVPA